MGKWKPSASRIKLRVTFWLDQSERRIFLVSASLRHSSSDEIQNQTRNFKIFHESQFSKFFKTAISKSNFFCKIWARFFALEIKCTVHSVVGQDTAAAGAEVNKINNIISRKFSFYLLLFCNFGPILRRKNYEIFNAPGEFEIYFAIRGLPNRGILAFSFFLILKLFIKTRHFDNLYF